MKSEYMLLIFNLFVLESLLSVDNAAVLAIMVKDLPFNQRAKALKYGILGAFVFRGLALILARYLVGIIWLKMLGGAYLLYLVYGHFTPKKDTIEEGVDKEHNKLFLKIKQYIGLFWSTVILVEIMDMAFSIDNIFAAVAMTSNIYIILIGVFMGIVSMRFVAQWFTVLINKHPSLEASAFVVIAILGIRLLLAGIVDYCNIQSIKDVICNHIFDMLFSGVMMLIFFIPLIQTKRIQQA